MIWEVMTLYSKSKMVYAGVFSNKHSVAESYGLPGYASIFYEEVLVILGAIDGLGVI